MLSGRRLRGDCLLVDDQEPPLGSHLVTPRRGYLHHGIYVGTRKVVHYPGLAHGLRRGPVEEVHFAHFACGQRVWVRSDAPPAGHDPSLSQVYEAVPTGHLEQAQKMMNQVLHGESTVSRTAVMFA